MEYLYTRKEPLEKYLQSLLQGLLPNERGIVLERDQLACLIEAVRDLEAGKPNPVLQPETSPQPRIRIDYMLAKESKAATADIYKVRRFNGTLPNACRHVADTLEAFDDAFSVDSFDLLHGMMPAFDRIVLSICPEDCQCYLCRVTEGRKPPDQP